MSTAPRVKGEIPRHESRLSIVHSTRQQLTTS